MIIILSIADVGGKAPRDYFELVQANPRLLVPASDADSIYVEGAGFIKDRNGDGAALLQKIAWAGGGR